MEKPTTVVADEPSFLIEEEAPTPTAPLLLSLLPATEQVALDMQSGPVSGEDRVASFYNMSLAGISLTEQEFDLKEELELLVETMRQAVNPKDRLNAQRQFRATLREIAQVSGLIQNRQAEQTLPMQGGGTATVKQSGSYIHRLKEANAKAETTSTTDDAHLRLKPIPFGADGAGPQLDSAEDSSD